MDQSEARVVQEWSKSGSKQVSEWPREEPGVIKKAYCGVDGAAPWSKSEPRVVQKSASKVIQKWYKSGPKVLQKGFKSSSKVVQKSSMGDPRVLQKWSKRGPKGGQRGGPKMVQNSTGAWMG